MNLVETLVLDQGRVVSAPWLAFEERIAPRKARSLLKDFVRSQRERGVAGQEVVVQYVLSGVDQQGVFTMGLVPESEVEEAAGRLAKVVASQLYSVGPTVAGSQPEMARILDEQVSQFQRRCVEQDKDPIECMQSLSDVKVNQQISRSRPATQEVKEVAPCTEKPSLPKTPSSKPAAPRNASQNHVKRTTSVEKEAPSKSKAPQESIAASGASIAEDRVSSPKSSPKVAENETAEETLEKKPNVRTFLNEDGYLVTKIEAPAGSGSSRLARSSHPEPSKKRPAAALEALQKAKSSHSKKASTSKTQGSLLSFFKPQ